MDRKGFPLMVNGGRQGGQPLSHPRRALSLGLQQPPGPQDGLPSPLGLPGGLGQGNELSKGTTGRQGSDAAAAHSWRCGHVAGALGSGSAPDAGLSLSGCYGDAIASPPPGSLGEGGRDRGRGRQEKPGLQCLKQRNPRSWISASGAEAMGERLGPGSGPWGEG